ncbi:PREDICTED: protein RIK isoform X2 [Populus euphratica]|uniref:Protein RIK n=1 Tax=Populus euphratica TaxID=75702 RepID=A0AAJ6WZD7_POPEU|nr:PREDICTED: protein RIK isoform X2 [Populus euphratica]
MVEESSSRIPTDDSTASSDTSSSQSRQSICCRRKRKWDQPAESLVSAGVPVSDAVQLGNVGSLVGISLPGAASVSGALLTNPQIAIVPPMFLAPSMPQNTAAVVPKLNQPKVQDELIIAREIVINDAESSVRYKLTKRQTQEEIQKFTGAVVITRGKYRPPNAPPDGEKPLYLHISAAAHLKDTAERILAVDRAAAMVDEMLKQGQSSQPASSITQMPAVNGVKALSACVFLGFDTDPTLNIAARIRGPNDQYISHIMNETGVTVILRGRGSGNCESQSTGESQQPLHLFLSASNPKCLEDAKRLSENLLDTISLECGASRASSCKVYNAVPPPQTLTGAHTAGIEHKLNTSAVTGLMLPTMSPTPLIPASLVSVSGVAAVCSQGTISQSGAMLSCGQPQPSVASYSQPFVMGGTSYSGYGGIYPQATPLQQVAQVLRQPPSPVPSTVSPATSIANAAPNSGMNSIAEKEKRPMQKRKFQEIPVGSKGPAKLHQGSEVSRSGKSLQADLGVRNISTMPAPKKLVHPSSSNGMPPPPPRAMPPPPPPPKFTSSTPAARLQDKTNFSNKTMSDAVPDTLVKLMEYGKDDDDPEDAGEESPNGKSSVGAVRKPFWAL